jgi:hypothetical protein
MRFCVKHPVRSANSCLTLRVICGKYTIMKINTLDFTLQDILLLIGMQARTGELVIEAGNNIGTIVFHQGKILQAFSPYSRAIGDLMVEDGLLTEAELIETLKIQKRNTYTPLGGLLLSMGKVTVDVVEMMVHEQIRQSVKEFQSWNLISCSFSYKEIEPFDRIKLSTYEFIPPETLHIAQGFISQGTPSLDLGQTSVSSTPSLL